MGNRAVITTEDNFKNNGLGLYMHWNGGRDSVEPLLLYTKLRGVGSPISDPQYFWARFSQIVGNFIGDTLSVVIGNVKNLDCDNYDNGVYIIDENFEIVDRKYFDGLEQNEYPLVNMLEAIDESQPEGEQLKDSIKDWDGNYEDLIPESLKKESNSNPYASVSIINVEKIDNERPYKVDIEFDLDSLVSNHIFYFNTLSEVNFYKNFADNGLDFVFCSDGLDLEKFKNLYKILNDPKKQFRVDNSMNRDNPNDFIPAIWSSDNIVIYEEENISLPSMSEDEFDRFKSFVENREFSKDNNIEVKEEPKKVR